jgi:hypothetical protein
MSASAHCETRRDKTLQNTRSSVLYAAVVLVTGLLLSGTASADQIYGDTSIGFGQVGVSLAGTDFFGFDASDSQCDMPGTGPGCFAIESGTGSFASLVNVNFAANLIADLPAPPLSGPDPITNFLSFDGGKVAFDLITVMPGGGTNCAGLADLTLPNLSCTIYSPDGTQSSPYLLTNGPSGQTVSVATTMYFNGYSGSAATGTTLYVGIFSTQLANETIAGIYNDIVQGGTESSSWSATFAPSTTVQSQSSPTAPEPGTLLLFGAGLICLAARFGYRRRELKTAAIAAVPGRMAESR